MYKLHKTKITLILLLGFVADIIAGPCVTECPPLSHCKYDTCECRKNFRWADPQYKTKCVFQKTPRRIDPRNFLDIKPVETQKSTYAPTTSDLWRLHETTNGVTLQSDIYSTVIASTTRKISTTSKADIQAPGFCIPPSPLCMTGLAMFILLIVAIIIVVITLCYCRKLRKKFQILE